MKKSDVLDLIKYHTENNDSAFKTTSYRIAESFDNSGDSELAEFILSMISGTDYFTPQEATQLSNKKSYLNEHFSIENKMQNLPQLLLPEAISNDITGIINSIKHGRGLNTFLFHGYPGTGKTQAVLQIARILKLEIKLIDFNTIIDSKLGQTSKNLSDLFKTINRINTPTIVLFDEIDALAMNRVDMNDLREMGRVTSTLMNGLDNISPAIFLFSTTNLFNHLDKALVRRFDVKIDFNRYDREDLLDIGRKIYVTFGDENLKQEVDENMFSKIFSLYEQIPYPAEIKNKIKVSFAFSNQDDAYSHLKVLYNMVLDDINGLSLNKVKENGFTYKELEKITGISKSSLAREVKRNE